MGISGEKLDWIKELVQSEERMEVNSTVDTSMEFDRDHTLIQETLRFLQALKNEMLEFSNTFNELKTSPLVGRIKVYGIARTQADFMLFRNGYKMIFSKKSPGIVSIRFNFLDPNQYVTAAEAGGRVTQLMEEHLIVAKRGPFKELQWTFQDQPVDFQAMVRYHMTLFVRESVK